MSKVLFFTASNEPTSADQDTLDNLAPHTVPLLDIGIRNAEHDDYTGYTDPEQLMLPDFVLAGEGASIPGQYSEVPVLNPNDLPTNLPDNQAVVSNGVAITGTGGTFTPTVVDGEITGGTWSPE